MAHTLKTEELDLHRDMVRRLRFDILWPLRTITKRKAIHHDDTNHTMRDIRKRSMDNSISNLEKESEDVENKLFYYDVTVGCLRALHKLAEGNVPRIAHITYNNFSYGSALATIFNVEDPVVIGLSSVVDKHPEACARIREMYDLWQGLIRIEFTMPRHQVDPLERKYSLPVQMSYNGISLTEDDMTKHLNYDELFATNEDYDYFDVEIIKGPPEALHDTKIVNVQAMIVVKKEGK